MPACHAGGRGFESRPVRFNPTFGDAFRQRFFIYYMAYYVYILQSQVDDSYYIGYTKDLNKRLFKHNQAKSG